MKDIFSNFITSLKAEHIKKKGTVFYWLSGILGAFAPIAYVLIKIMVNNLGNLESRNTLPYNYYLDFIQDCLNPFTYVFFPLCIIILVSRLTQLDHKNGGWQLMETQPINKFSIYFSKFSVILIANLISIFCFLLFGLLSAWILSLAIPIPKSATTSLPLGDLFHLLTRLFVASLFLTALQYVISVLIPSFIWSVLIGFFGLLSTPFLTNFGFAPSWHPFTILFNVLGSQKGSDFGYWFIYTEYAGILCTIITLYLGYNWYKFKTFKLAFYLEKNQLVKSLLVILVFGSLTFYVLKPNQMAEANSTVLCGKIESDLELHKLYIIDQIIKDTIAIIPIKNNSFTYKFTTNVILDYYTIIIDNKISSQIFFGKNDSLFIDAKFLNSESEFKIKGTRLAENQLARKQENDWSLLNYWLQENNKLENVKVFSDQLYKEWKEKIAVTNKFKTVDNYIPKSDYTERNRKLISVKYLNFWDQFVKKRSALYPTQKTEENANIKDLKAKISLSDESLLSNDDYFKYINTRITADNKQDVDANTKSIEAIAKLPANAFKDKMLFKQMTKSIEEASNNNDRNQLVSKYSNLFVNKKYQAAIIGNTKLLESLAKGQPAPLFAGYTLENKLVSLSDLKGKFVVVDVWATWCGPCQMQSPYFEKFALKYKKEKIQFVSISIDDRKDKWFIDAKSKSQSVLQLLSTNKETLSNNYNFNSIPTFILIDSSGSIVVSKMPFPSEPFFEILLRTTLGLPDEK